MKTSARSWWMPVALAALAAALPPAGRALAGPQGATVHVRWQSSVTESERRSIEARFRLAEGVRLDQDTWRYDLIDTSSDNIRALIVQPGVADTHNIDRSTGVLDPSASRTARRLRLQQGDRVVAVADLLAIALGGVVALLTLAGVARRIPPARAAWLRAESALFQPLPDGASGSSAEDRGGKGNPRLWTAVVLMISAPVVLTLCLTLWQSPFPITEAVSLFEEVEIEPITSFLSPNTAYYRPLYHMTLSTLWHNVGSLDTRLALIKLLTIVPVLLLVVLFAYYIRPQTALDAAAASIAVAVMVGSPGFRDNLELPLHYTIVGMPLALMVWILLNRQRRTWHTPLVVACTLVAIGFKEQGLVLVPLVIAGWWTGARGASRGMAFTVAVIGLAYVALRLSGGASWEPFQQAVGLGFTELEEGAAAARFGAFPYWMYAYNGASTVANILFAEPTRGTFRIVHALVEGEPELWQILQLGSSVAMTIVIAWWGIDSVKGTSGGQWSADGRLFVALIVVVLASGALSFNYSRDRLGGMAVVFYAIAAFFAVREALTRILPASRARFAVAGLGLMLLAAAWQTRSVATLEYARVHAQWNHEEWFLELPVRRIERADRTVHIDIMESMVDQGRERGAPRGTRFPDWVFRAVGHP